MHAERPNRRLTASPGRTLCDMAGSIGTAVQLGLPQRVDVAVVGSGAAGLVAALSAAVEGSTVLVVESEPLVGGTTAISGGAAWVPNHGLAYRELGENDSVELARRYLLGEGRDAKLELDLVDAFLAGAPKMARFVEKHTYLSWLPTVWPDYHSDIPGASNVRSLLPGIFPSDVLGGSGYLGSGIVRALSRRGHQPVPFSRHPLSSHAHLPAIAGDLRSRADVEAAVSRC